MDFNYKFEIRNCRKPWLSRSKSVPDLDYFALRVIEFNNSVRGLITLSQNSVDFYDSCPLMQDFFKPEWHFTERGLGSDLDTLKDLTMMMQGECIVTAKPKGDGKVSVKIKIRKGQIYQM